ncbi:hypothetical protein G4B88_006841 [Cannabis sativa]|uniref:Cytochrome P450 n=1 Tax=Cannabis sativa TaxID=3483 RepID=A0A7J6G3K7_CANSA|nr:hypothetical protein G4B88_006841 [Cannabis sativa]
MVAASYGDHWRNLRRIGSIEIFSASRLKSHLSTRTDEINRLLHTLAKNSLSDFDKVEMKSLLSNMTFNIIMRMVAGKRYYGDDVANKEEANMFMRIFDEAVSSSGVANPADFLPVGLKWLAMSYELKMKRASKKMDAYLQRLVDERRSMKSDITMIDHLLALQESHPEYYSDEIIKGFILVLLLAGTDTSSVTLEWALSNLLNHPEVLEKAKAEIDEKIGEKLMEEEDISKLPYLNNIISETLRLFPPAPMLLPHYSSEDCTIEGYDIPRDTMVMVNVWAIHRDPKLWDDPLSFKPERFERINDEKYLMPFGLGRRACPGHGLAQRVLGLTLGSLIQCFEWKRIDPFLYGSLSFITIIILIFFIKTKNKKHYKNLPPSPPSYPIIGHLHLLKPRVHRIFHSLSAKYGDVFTLWFGSRRVVVVSSPSAVEECFTKNDIVLANRPPLLMGKHISYNYTTIVAAPYGDHWRNLRRIGAVEIFSTARLNLLLNIRKDEIDRLLRKINRSISSNTDRAVEMKSMLTELTFNIVMRMMAGKRYYGDDVTDDEEARKFREIMKAVFENGGAGNQADFLPILNWVPNSYEKRIEKLAKKTDSFLQGLIDEHRNRKDDDDQNSNLDRNTMIDHLLTLQQSQPEYYTDQIIKGFVLILLLAGTDTSAVTLEWTMSNLLNHPHVLQKLKDELDSQIGQQQLVDESDLSKLPYLQNVISETLRLYPAAPLLVPHYSSNDCTISGFDVPRDTIVLVNAWAIHRDPKLWEDAEIFKPERFENIGKGSENGEGYKLMPFGLGRRSCPGIGLAQRVVGLTLGSLIQCFEWERVSEEKIDMSENKGLTMPKLVPLEALCKPLKPPIHRVLHNLSTKYGEIFLLRLGFRRVVVVSSSTIAQECLTKNDIVFANRPHFLLAKHVGYNSSNVVDCSYGEHWRNLRRIGAIEIFSSGRLNLFINSRRDEVIRLLKKLSCQDSNRVELKSMFQELTFNIITRMVAGKRYCGDDVANEEEAKLFRDTLRTFMEFNGAGNAADFLPILNWIPINNFENKVKRLGKTMDSLLEGLIKEHKSNKDENRMNTVIEHLLSLQDSQPEYYTNEIIKGFVMQSIAGGTDTSALTLEWAMLYPVGPLLVPHYSSNDCNICGYDVPRDTILLVNVWAIHRDPKLWEDAENFKPERFENINIENEFGYKLMPFGVGRRSCPGRGLASRVIGLALGSLIQCFDWEKVDHNKIDMTEGKGLTMPKVVSLEAICKAHCDDDDDDDDEFSIRSSSQFAIVTSFNFYL